MVNAAASADANVSCIPYGEIAQDAHAATKYQHTT